MLICPAASASRMRIISRYLQKIAVVSYDEKTIALEWSYTDGKSDLINITQWTDQGNQMKEVLKEGKATIAWRPLEPRDFKQTVSILNESTDVKKRYMVTAIKFQFHLIAQLGDICCFE
jgi:predicted ABC-type transport system involved in lysophospholipase L1 biosynthesis ATPase subunit